MFCASQKFTSERSITFATMQIGFGIIGCGYIAHRHIKHIIDHVEANPVGVYDTDTSKMHAFAKQYQTEAYISLAALLAEDAIELVVICTPNGSHAQLAIEAMKAGKHVLVEKPMATSYEDARQMHRVSEETGKSLYVVKQNRYNPPVQAVKELLDSGKPGALRMVSLNCFWNRNADYYRNSDWKGSKKWDGGTLYTQFSHFVDILYYLFGEVKHVNGRIVNAGHRDLTEIEDSGTFHFELEQGGLGSLVFSTCAYNKNMEGSITILAEHATIKIGGKYLNTIDYQETNGFDIKHLPASGPANNYGYYQGSMSNHDKVIHNVIQALKGKEPIMTGAKDGLEVVKMIDQFYAAAAE